MQHREQRAGFPEAFSPVPAYYLAIYTIIP